MLSTRVFETRGAKLIAAVAAVLLLAAFQVALQAKPAHAWEMRVTITGAGTVEETTRADLLNCSTLLTPPTPTGQTGAICLAGTPSGDYQNLWDVDYLATPASGYTFKRWESDGTTRNPIICDRSNPPATTATYSGSNVCKFRATGNLQTRVVFADEQSPSMPTITNTSPSANTVNGPKAFNFSIDSDPTFKEFQCRVTPNVQTNFQSCTSGVSFNPSADGTYTFQVRAVDWSGNMSAAQFLSWTVDKTAPTVGITSGPYAFSFSNDPSPTFGFSRGDAVSVQCSLDGAPFGPCTGSTSQSYSNLSDGSHTFQLKATDAVGNTGQTNRTWTIDTVAPNTTLDPNVGPAPNTTTQDNDPVFQFSSNDAGATFECNLTGPGMTSNTFTACNASPGTSPGTFTKSYPNLKDGSYTFKVRAKDQATNVDISPEQRTWTINNTPTVLTNSLTPAKGATGVSRTTNVSATFSEEMAPTSIANLTTHVSKTFKLQMYNKKKKKWMAVPATVDVTNSNTTAVLDPYGATEGATEKPLAASKKFKATITTGVTDAQGNAIAKNFVWTFNTGSV
jgi:large repetitive protein